MPSDPLQFDRSRDINAALERISAMATEAMRLATETSRTLAAHEGRCTERWNANKGAWEQVDRRLSEQTSDAQNRTATIHAKIDMINATMFKIALSIISLLVGVMGVMIWSLFLHK